MSDDLAKEARERWTEAESADHDNREEALEDLKFAAPDNFDGQWDKRVRTLREERGPFPLPCLTINTLPQFIGQVVGDWIANPASIKVLPREDGDKDVAEIRSELIRSIELQSRADRVYKTAFEQAVTCGQGAFRIDLDYAYEDAFERDLFIRPTPNPLATLWDPLASDPTGRDAGYCFVTDQITRSEFTRRFPKASPTNTFDTDVKAAGWFDANMVRVAEYWRMEERERRIALMQDGTVQDVTDEPEAKWRERLFLDEGGKPRIRDAKCRYASMILTNGQEQLSDPFELKIPRLPIIRVMGREVWVGDKRVRFGLVRYARDPQRLKNYWRSVVAELLMSAQRANYIAAASAIKGREDDWANTLVYNDNTNAPQPVTGVDLAAILNEAQLCAQDMKDTTGLHDASLGMRSNETSGVAIQRRQHEGDIATIVYRQHMNDALQEGGDVLNALLDVAFDTTRTLRAVGQDGAVKMVRINDPDDPEAIDLSKGRYDTTISTGPAFQTRRQEAASSMMEYARVAPHVMERAGDLIAKSQDWPNADEIAERLRPPGITDPEDMTEEQQAEAAQAAQAAQMAQQLEMAAAQAELREKVASARLKEAQADEAEAKAEKARAEAQETRAKLALAGAHLAETADELEEAA